MSRKEQLQEKYNTNPSFREEMKKAQEYYNAICSKMFFSNIQHTNKQFIVTYHQQTPTNRMIYFIYGAYQYQRASSKQKLVEHFVKKIQKPTKPYIIIYFNSEQYSDGFSNFKQILELMPFEYLYYIQKILLMQPTFSQKASTFFTFGSIPKYINQHLQYVDNIHQLCIINKFNQQQIFNYLPCIVKESFAEQFKKKNISTCNCKTNVQYTIPISSSQYINKQQIKMLQIDQYEKSEEGLPKIFINLIYYFTQHPQALKQIGIFRQSSNVIEEQQLFQKLVNKNYQCLKQISNPYLISNLIKKFLSSLLTPLIPQHLFSQILNQKNINVKFLANIMEQLWKINNTKLLTLTKLTKFLIHSVILQSAHNKMNTSNVAVCIAPCIMKQRQVNVNGVENAKKAVDTYIIMLNNFNEVFGNQNVQNQLDNSMYLSRRQHSYYQIQQAFSMGSNISKRSTFTQRPCRATIQFAGKPKKLDTEQSVQGDYEQLCNIKLGLQSKIKPIKEQPNQNESNLKNQKYINKQQQPSHIQSIYNSRMSSNNTSKISFNPQSNTANQQESLSIKISPVQQQFLKNRASCNQEQVTRSKIFQNSKVLPQQVIKSRLSTNQQQVFKSKISFTPQKSDKNKSITSI